ncbi:metallophosphoesterase [Beijerinckia indica]|uniref:Metallophosphoesterase n=1 Tax=Beijerinckia indica subsp. indica (strain ATCC 9039 / DSM 1715 / NCIMB 8712) TaxID=395963 RepID=B2II10_BEII9|nr:metallophosphoesterase [Beijerinckia indica]ACB94593.1 metallophosphoesterase [Beijerinckia indica subsp. indica ATCC 9039]
MPLFTRRNFLLGAGTCVLAGAGTTAYATAIEAGLRLEVTRYSITPPHWPKDLTLRAAVISDIHACEPWMPPSRVRLIAEVANSLSPDIIFLLGDFNGGNRVASQPVWPEQWAEALSILSAPLGSYAILGNHDWMHGPLPYIRGDKGESIRRALAPANIKLLENDALRLNKDGRAFWVAGLGSQTGYFDDHHRWTRGMDDLPGTLAKVTDQSPVLFLAHEPYIFHKISDTATDLGDRRISLTLSGHTHGNQINVPFLTPHLVKRPFVQDLVYGHIVRNGHHLLVSGGLGTSVVPVRINRPPEVLDVTIKGTGPALAASM